MFGRRFESAHLHKRVRSVDRTLFGQEVHKKGKHLELEVGVTSLGPKRSSRGLWIIECITRIVLLKGDVNLTFKQDNQYSGAYQLDLEAQPLATGIPSIS